MKLNSPAIRKAMGDYAISVGYPERVSVKEFAQNHSNPLFTYLLQRGLVRTEWYNAYRQAVITEYKKWYVYNRK